MVQMEIAVILFWVVGFVLGCLILYNIIKVAVVNGIRDSGLLEREHERYVEQKILESKPNSAQMLLKQKYENGEIDFEAYKE